MLWDEHAGTRIKAIAWPWTALQLWCLETLGGDSESGSE